MLNISEETLKLVLEHAFEDLRLGVNRACESNPSWFNITEQLYNEHDKRQTMQYIQGWYKDVARNNIKLRETFPTLFVIFNSKVFWTTQGSVFLNANELDYIKNKIDEVIEIFSTELYRQVCDSKFNAKGRVIDNPSFIPSINYLPINTFFRDINDIHKTLLLEIENDILLHAEQHFGNLEMHQKDFFYECFEQWFTKLLRQELKQTNDLVFNKVMSRTYYKTAQGIAIIDKSFIKRLHDYLESSRTLYANFLYESIHKPCIDIDDEHI
jgi:hypothetical protein